MLHYNLAVAPLLAVPTLTLTLWVGCTSGSRWWRKGSGIASSGHSWQCPETVLAATVGEWVETRDSTKHPVVHILQHLPPSTQQRMIQPQMSIVPRLRDSRLTGTQ